jgi:hypothetical protein
MGKVVETASQFDIGDKADGGWRDEDKGQGSLRPSGEKKSRIGMPDAACCRRLTGEGG